MASPRLSVTRLRCACLNREWLEAWLAGGNPEVRSFVSTGTGIVFGQRFHCLAEAFTAWLAGAATQKQTVPLADGDALWGAMFDGFAGPVLAEIATEGRPVEAMAFKERLHSFCERLAALRSGLPEFKSWRDLLLVSEHTVSELPFTFGPRSIFVSGRIDAVRMALGNELVIVDYKLSRGTQLKHDLLQLAIYAALLERKRPGLRFHGLLEYYEPAVHTVTATPQELRTLFDTMVLPVLKEMAERSPASSRPSQPVTPPAPPPGPPTPPPASPAANDEISSDHSEAIRKCYLAFKLEVSVLGREQAPQLIRYRVKPAAGVKVVSLINRTADLQVALSLAQAPLIEAAAGYVTVDIPRKHPDGVPWKEVMALPEVKDHPSPVSFPIGIGVDGAVVLADFQNSNMAHMLVAGASGSGKSEFLKSMVATLISRCKPETLRLVLIDPKILTFGPLKNCRHLLQPVITDLTEALNCLDWAVTEMEKRYRQLAAEKFENIGQRAKAGKRGMPWLILIFDEFADLILSSAGEKKQFETLVARLAAKGRAAGIHLVLATQRPDKNIVTGLIKANLPLKVCLRVASGINSQIVIEDPGGSALLGRGDLLCDRGRNLERAQSPFISAPELTALADA